MVMCWKIRQNREVDEGMKMIRVRMVPIKAEIRRLMMRVGRWKMVNDMHCCREVS